MRGHTECRRLATLLGWDVTPNGWVKCGPPNVECLPRWPFVGAVLEEMARRGILMTVGARQTGGWRCTFTTPSAEFDSTHHHFIADTAPQAVVDAALAATGGRDDG